VACPVSISTRPSYSSRCFRQLGLLVKRGAGRVLGARRPALARATVDVVAIVFGDSDADCLRLSHTRNIPVADDRIFDRLTTQTYRIVGASAHAAHASFD
jgi:hypothetical protein